MDGNVAVQVESIPTAGSGAFGTIKAIRGTVPMRQLQSALKFVF